MLAMHRCPSITALACVALGACASAPSRPPPDPASTAAAFAARRLDMVFALPPVQTGWDLAQWFEAAQQLNPGLAEARAHVVAIAAAERTAAERPNPTLDLFGEYVTTAAHSAAWLYGLSLDFLLRRPGERARAVHRAALESALAESDLTESLWLVRAALRQALLDAASAQRRAHEPQ